MKINLGSQRFAFSLIGLILLLIIISAIVPQKDIAEEQVIDWHEKLGDKYVIIENLYLDRIYYSPYFFILLGCLGINLIFGNIKRFQKVIRIENNLLKLKHIGSIIFHLSLLFIIISVVLNYLYKYEGVFALTEGQLLEDAEEIYIKEYKGPIYKDKYNNFTMRLDSLNEIGILDDRTNTRASVQLKFHSENPISGEIALSNPLSFDVYDFHYGLKRGFSPEIIVSDTAGNQLFRSFVRLASSTMEGKPVHRDYIELFDSNLKVEIKVEVDKIDKDSLYFSMDLYTESDTIKENNLVLGDSLILSTYIVKLNKVRQWCQFAVVKNAYVSWIFFGFWAALSGMVIGFIPRVIKG